MIKSESISDLAAALSKAQAKIEGAVKDKENPGFRGSKYADLSAVWDAIRAPLTENGLSVTQWLRSVEGGVEVETMLLHSTGQYISDAFAVPVTKRDAQGYGSAATYARRYSLMAAVGIAPVDDDGNAATGRHEDPIAQAKHTAVTEDRHLLVNGNEQSQYETTKAANGGKTPYMVNKEKREAILKFVTDGIAAHGQMTTVREIDNWWNDPERQPQLEFLKAKMPEEYKKLDAAAVERVNQVQRVPRERNVMQAG